MRCVRCGYKSENKLQTYSCPLCGGILTETDVSPVVQSSIPWESHKAKQFPFAALLDTLHLVLFKPDRFFRSCRKTGNNRTAWFFGLLTGSFGVTATALWAFLLPSQPANQQISPALLFLSPLLITVQLLIATVYIHLMLIITRAQKLPIRSTFRIISYAEAAMVLTAIPVAGPLLSYLIWIVLVITGVHHFHKISKLRAFFAVLLPIFFLAGLVLILLIFISIIGAVASEFLRELFPLFR